MKRDSDTETHFPRITTKMIAAGVEALRVSRTAASEDADTAARVYAAMTVREWDRQLIDFGTETRSNIYEVIEILRGCERRIDEHLKEIMAQ